jgi:trehalose 6-phosphate phosphatase
LAHYLSYVTTDVTLIGNSSRNVLNTLSNRYIYPYQSDVSWAWESLMPISKEVSFMNFRHKLSPCQIIRCNSEKGGTTVRCLVLDYDGTISPLDVERAQSRVPRKTRAVLQRIGRLIPIAIVTTKDLWFVVPRTSFAQAWSAMSGLETKIGGKIRRKESLLHSLERVSLALKYATSHLKENGTEIEEKQDILRRTVAFCVDWRRAKNVSAATKEADSVAALCRRLGLNVVRYETQPFFDVYPMPVDKGTALVDLLKEMGVTNYVLYMGDSEADNPAFEKSNISVGVVHEETFLNGLTCDFYVKFENVSAFLGHLLENNLVFEPNFSMIEINVEKMRKKCTKE